MTIDACKSTLATRSHRQVTLHHQNPILSVNGLHPNLTSGWRLSAVKVGLDSSYSDSGSRGSRVQPDTRFVREAPAVGARGLTSTNRQSSHAQGGAIVIDKVGQKLQGKVHVKGIHFPAAGRLRNSMPPVQGVKASCKCVLRDWPPFPVHSCTCRTEYEPVVLK